MIKNAKICAKEGGFMKLAISTWSFQQRLASGAMTQMDCISKAKELGADAIEFVDVLPPDGVSREDYARQLGEACKEQGLGVSNYTIGARFSGERRAG